MIVGLVLFGIVSLLINVVMGAYLTKLLSDHLFVVDEISEMQERIEEFRGHLEIVYELETFYGDETLSNLLRHAKAFGRYMESFGDITDLSLPEQTEEELEEIYDNKKENNTREEKTTRTGKVVFYGGA